MGIQDDYQEIIKENKAFILSHCLSQFHDFYTKFRNRLPNEIQEELIDPSDLVEQEAILKKKFDEIKTRKVYHPNGSIPPTVYQWIQITEGNLLNINKEGMLRSSNHIWHNYSIKLAQEIGSFIPAGYSVWMSNAYYTIQIRVMKEYLLQIRKQDKRYESREIYPFRKDGYLLFLYLNENFINVKPTVKYSALFDFLVRKGALRNNFEEYKNSYK